MSYNLFLDDYRQPNSAYSYTKLPIYLNIKWIVVSNYHAFISLIQTKGIPEIISFDHDLASEHYEKTIVKSQTYDEMYDLFDEKTGYHCAKWLIDYCIDNQKEIPDKIMIHSMNPAGSMNIKSLFDTYYKVMNMPLKEIYMFCRIKT